MQSFKVFNHGVEVEFKGRLLAKTDTRKNDDQYMWTEFQIYVTEENKLVVDVLRVHADGERSGRSFFCSDLYDVQQALGHPALESVSFRAQICYNLARKELIRMGMIDSHEYPLTLDEEDRPVKFKKPSARVGGLPKPSPDFDDFDFSD